MRIAPVSIALALLFGAPDAKAADVADQPPDLGEVVVTAQRVQLQEMRKELIRLEDRFYERYNDLNTKAAFDIHCVSVARTGTRFIKRTCRAQYEDDAVQAEGQGALAALQTMRSAGNGQVASPPEPPMMAILARQDEFRAHMQSVVRHDRQLQELLRERAELLKRYEAMRRKIFKRYPSERDAESVDTDLK